MAGICKAYISIVEYKSYLSMNVIYFWRFYTIILEIFTIVYNLYRVQKKQIIAERCAIPQYSEKT